jgi:hypothetical protein
MSRPRNQPTLPEATLDDLLAELRRRSVACAVGIATIDDGGKLRERLFLYGPHVVTTGLAGLLSGRAHSLAQQAMQVEPFDDNSGDED